jgi:hypothetical protein
MRLGQIAKKLGVRPSEVVALLKERNLPVAEGSNNRLKEEQVRLVMDHWSTPDDTLFSRPEMATEEETRVEEPLETAVPDSTISGAAENPELPAVTSEKVEPSVEVIRAPKVELSGLKVIGKIELPEIRKKEKVKPKSEHTERNSKAGDRSHRKGTNPRKNPIALQRERDQREAREKRIQQEAQAKELRTQRYLEKRNAAAPAKASKKRKRTETTENGPQEPIPTTWLGRFWKWYRS